MIRQNRLFYKLLQHYISHNTANKGFVLPMVIGLGLIMTVAGLTMVIRSSDQQIAAEQKVQNDQARVAAETGITRVMAVLNRFPSLAGQPDEKWGDGTKAWNNKECGYQEVLTGLVNQGWIQLNEQSAFRVNDYNPGSPAQLTVSATVTPDNINPDNLTNEKINDNNLAISRIQVNVPNVTITASDSDFTIAATDNVSLEGNQVQGNVTVKTCDLENTNINEENIEGDGNQVITDPFLDYPPLPKESKINWQNSGGRPEQISGGIENNMTLPASDGSHSDAKDENGVYHYVVEPNNNGNSIDLSGGNSLGINPEKKIALHLQGNVNVSGNSQIYFNFKDSCVKNKKNKKNPDINYTVENGKIVDQNGNECGKGDTSVGPSTLQIYGGDGKTEGFYNGEKTTEICLSGNVALSNFILAPEASAGVNGGGGQGVSILGNAWIKNWSEGGGGSSCGSNSNQLVAAKPADWNLENLVFEPNNIPRDVESPQNFQELPNQLN